MGDGREARSVQWRVMKNYIPLDLGERRKEKGERRKEKGESREEKGGASMHATMPPCHHPSPKHKFVFIHHNHIMASTFATLTMPDGTTVELPIMSSTVDGPKVAVSA